MLQNRISGLDSGLLEIIGIERRFSFSLFSLNTSVGQGGRKGGRPVSRPLTVQG